MKKNKAKILIGCGIFCVLCILVSSWYAVKFNDSRLVVPMDFNSYTFQIKDLPMIISVSLICIYVFTLFITLIVSIGRNRQQIERTNTTRKLNPKLGFLGLLGFWVQTKKIPTAKRFNTGTISRKSRCAPRNHYAIGKSTV